MKCSCTRTPPVYVPRQDKDEPENNEIWESTSSKKFIV